MSSEPRERALSTAASLTGALERMAGELRKVNEDSQLRDAALAGYGRRNRVFIVLDVLLTIVSTAAVAAAVHASSRASAASVSAAASRNSLAIIHGNQIRACQLANTQRRQQAHALDTILRLAATPRHVSAARRAQIVAFRRRAIGEVDRGWDPLNCGALYRLPRGRSR